MSRINDLDKVLDYVRIFSKDLAPIKETDLSLNVDIEIDLLVEYLEELRNRGFITFDQGGSYITLKGRMALENARNGKPFSEELENKRIKKTWSVIKIVAAFLNALAIISIAIWAQIIPNTKENLEKEYILLKNKYEDEQKKQENRIDSLKTVIKQYQIEIPQNITDKDTLSKK